MDRESREKAFGEALSELRREARENGGVTTGDRVREVFAPFSLDEKQLEDVFTYLKESHIGIDTGSPDAEEYLSDGEINILSEYLESLGSVPERSEEERLEIAGRAVAGDEEAQQLLAECYIRTIPDIARLYVQQGVFLEDLIGEGNVALYHGVTLLGALDDPAEAESTLTKYVMDAMEGYIAENLQEDARGQRAVNRVNEVADRAKELYEDLRRPVTVEELAGETGWSREKILEAYKLAGGEIEELDVKAEDLK